MLNGECTVHSWMGSVPAMKYSVTTESGGQYGFASSPVVRSISRVVMPSGRGQSGGAGRRR